MFAPPVAHNGYAPGAAGWRSTAWAVGKRVLDFVMALVVLVMLLPILLAVAVAVRLDSSGPILFRQVRCGRHRKPFVMLKFRTMTHGASEETHRDYIAHLADGGDEGEELKKLAHDPRVTRVGAFLRRTSLDELPQLFNVIAGQMSVVGPRPALDYELEHYEPSDYARFDVRPGLTGLWQVSGRNRLGFREMLTLDAEYARMSSPGLDARILVRTPIELVRGHAR